MLHLRCPDARHIVGALGDAGSIGGAAEVEASDVDTGIGYTRGLWCLRGVSFGLRLGFLGLCLESWYRWFRSSLK